MKQKGSITVFLSLILVLLFSFLMTMLEGARIRGATAYASMVSELAGDSFLASYYYPLFQEYRLFGVDAGTEEGYLSERGLSEKIAENLEYGLMGLKGGLLNFEKAEVSVTGYKTMMAEEGEEFLSQIREQLLLDGVTLAVTEIFNPDQVTEIGVAGSLYQKQEETLEELATVTEEILSLMTLADGVCTGSNGLVVGKDGKLKAETAFIKQLLPVSGEQMRQSYENEEIYNAVSGSFFRADEEANIIKSLVQEAMRLEEETTLLENTLAEQEAYYATLEESWKSRKEEITSDEILNRLEEAMMETELAIAEAKEGQKDCESRRKTAIADAKVRYQTLQKKVQAVEPVLEKSLKTLKSLEEKQEKAKTSVSSYELFLDGMEDAVSPELYEMFAKELEMMKLYAGMEESGYYVPIMQQSVEHNLSLLQGFSFEGFSEKELGRVLEEMEAVADGMASYTADGFSFTYGRIVVAEQTGANVLGTLEELLTTGMLELVGVSEENQSDRSLTGEALPSAVLEGETIWTDFMGCMEEVQEIFSSEGVRGVLKSAADGALDMAALELYGMKYFGCFTEPSDDTKLKYEREYIVFGAEKDKTNLFYMVLYLVAVRTLFCMISILGQSEKMTQIENLATCIAGCTGIPTLLAVVKYAVILLWSVEEALIEVAALLQGKRIPIWGDGTISMGELLSFNKGMIQAKVAALSEGAGATYEDYLALLSLTKSARKKMYRAMDLIQENIRCRYRDSFRLRNVVTELEFSASSRLEALYSTGWFPADSYNFAWKEHCAY